MTLVKITENTVELATLAWFHELGYETLYGPDISPDGEKPERESYDQVILTGRLKDALVRINPGVPEDALDDAIRKVSRADSPSMYENNQQFHRYLTDGVTVEYENNEGRFVHSPVYLIDFDDPDNNDWLAVNQFTVLENHINRRPDVVVFVNGMPLAVIELKNPGDERATINTAFRQLQTYKQDIPSLFQYNEALVVSDGTKAKAGTITGNWEWFIPWRTTDGIIVDPTEKPQLGTLIKGIFEKQFFLDLIRYFIVFEVDGSVIKKKIASYHQFHAVRKAVECTVKASSETGDKRVGVVWHTQGSGKSLSMAFYAGKIMQHPSMANPTLVVITDRNDLDEQLFGTFSSCGDLIREVPKHAASRDNLHELLRVASGGVIFTTIQKFFPEEKGEMSYLLSKRRNIVLIVDEAHRSHYGFIKGFARHIRETLPNASFIGFTGTPIETADKSTPAVFGDYIDIYDIERAVEDGATVPIYYEGRIAKLELKEEEKPNIDSDFEEVTEGEEVERKEKLKSKWARLEAMVGTEKRINLVARDIVKHFRERLEIMDGKGMIVCMSRRICVDVYNAITKIHPEWHDTDDNKGYIKIVMTGSASDPPEWQQHIRNKQRRGELSDRFKNPNDEMKLVIVRDMWLTGFDCPPLHTMYVDKPMRGHGLMQAIARVNRVWLDKPGGLMVDYIGLADALRKAMVDYTESGGKGVTTLDQEEAVAVMLEKYEIVEAMFYGFDWSMYFDGDDQQRLTTLAAAENHILEKLEDGKKRYLKATTELSNAFALAVPNEQALAIKDYVGFFQAVRAGIVKHTLSDARPEEDLDFAIKQLISRAVSSEGIIDLLSELGAAKPDISILSDEFLAEVKDMPYKNLAVEMLQKLLNDEIKIRERKFLVEARSFKQKLEEAIKKYHNRAIETIAVIVELIGLAKEMRDAHKRGEDIGLTEDELAFYDALEVNDSAVMILGDEILREIARELADKIRKNVSIDWTVRESARARMRVMIKRILRKHGYPPDKQESATKTVIEQAELICQEWAA